MDECLFLCNGFSCNLNMEELPVEIVEAILGSNRLSIEDTLNFGATCSQLRYVVNNSNVTWKKRYMQRWPELYALVENDITDWLDELKYVFELRQRSRHVLSTMSQRFYAKVELSDPDFDDWLELMNERKFNYEYLVHDLISIINCIQPIQSIQIVPVITPGNKTLRYYSRKVLRFLRQHRLSIDWQEFISHPENERILEKGASVIAQWFQPEVHIYWREISKALDDIANQVKEHLVIMNPAHSIFNAPQEILDQLRIGNLDDNMWNEKECREILASMKYVLYEKLGFCGNTSNYYMPQNSYINEVLDSRQGLPITLAIVYEGVGRRLGINCEPISSPAHFLLRFSEGRKPHTFSYYIDVFNKGEIIKTGGCVFSRARSEQGRSYPRATAREVVERMANNLEVALRDRAQSNSNAGVTLMRSVLEFLVLVNPQDLTTIVYLARLYMTYNMDTSKLETLLLGHNFESSEQAQRVLNMLRGYVAHSKYSAMDLFNQNVPTSRKPEIKYAVGMVMEHLLFNYKCVICEWHPTCMATIEWQKQMNIEKLKYKGNQPFYSVLVEDGSKRYVAQENLQPTRDTGFLYLNEDIGRYFSHFFETHYVPNAEKEEEYPEDREVRHMYYQKMMFGGS